MTKAEIVEDIAAKTGLTKKEIAEAVDQFLVGIDQALFLIKFGHDNLLHLNFRKGFK